MSDKNLKIGFHTHSGHIFENSPEFYAPIENGGGVDFLLIHADGSDRTLAEDCENARRLAALCEEKGVDFIANFEKHNFILNCRNYDGYDWANHPDGTHRLSVPEEYVKALNSRNNCLGIMYDEFEHVIINRNISLALASKYRVDMPVFPVTGNSNLAEQDALLDKQLREYKEEFDKKGSKTLSGEHVWAVLFHKFAKNGIIPNFKSQKESFSNVQFAIAAGAAKQYGTPLFNCVDMWYRMTFPGHSAKEMYNNLRFAYLSGVDMVYVEAVDSFFDKKENGEKEFNEIGREFNRFTEEYRGKDRGYNVQDYRPEIGIIRLDDTFWGQGRCRFMWRNMLYGNPKIKPDSRSKEWISAFNIITHGETGNGGLSWGRLELRSLTPHRSFASMNSPVVYDENATEKDLESLKLCFLCGVKISDGTMRAVRKLVRENGLTVVCPTRFAPFDIFTKAGQNSSGEAKDGKGCWIVTDNLKSPKLKKRLSPFLGNKGEMSFSFKDRKLRMKISDNGEEFITV